MTLALLVLAGVAAWTLAVTALGLLVGRMLAGPGAVGENDHEIYADLACHRERDHAYKALSGPLPFPHERGYRRALFGPEDVPWRLS